MSKNGNNKRFFKYLMAGIALLILIGLIHISGIKAQWGPYNYNNWFSGAPFGPSFTFLNTIPGYGGNSFYPSYGNYYSTGLFSFPGLTYGGRSIGIYGPYSGLNPSGLFPSPGSWFSGGSIGPGGYVNSGGYPWSNPYSTLSPYFLSPLSQGPWIGGSITSPYGPFTFPPQLPGNIYSSPQPNYYCDPESAPGKMEGDWSSQELKDEENNPLTGELSISREEESGTIKMLDYPIALGEGTLTEFQYTRTAGKAPISFKGQFYSGYTAEFTGTANNKLCCRNHMCFWAGVFEVEGEYRIKDKLEQIADRGTFKIKGPVSSSKPRPTPVDAIKALGKPIDEGRKILSLTTGADGRIYGGTDIGCVNVGHMFVCDPATGEITDLGNPGYECNAMTTGTDGLIYLGGGTKSAGDHDCKSIGYANFAIYDPSRPWNPGQGSNANPRNLGQAVNYSGEVDGYPIVVHDLATAPDGRIYGCTGHRDGTSGEYYAHLFVYDPQTDTIENLGQPIPNQSSITRLAIAPDGIIYGVILGPRTGYRPPPGKLFSYNPASASFALINTPSTIEGAGDLTVGTDGLLYVAGNENNTTIFTYDPVSKSFDIKGSLGGNGSVLRMITTVDGIIYIGCAVSGYFVRYDPERAWEDRPYSEANDKPGVNPRVYHWTGKVNALTEGQDGIIYFGNLSGQLFYFAGEEEPSS